MKTLSQNGIRFALMIVLALVLMLGLTGSAAAAEFSSGDTIVIGAEQVIDDDLFLTANTVVMNGTVNGNLFAFGRQIEINGTVNGNAIIGGQSMTVSGQVRDSLYAGGAGLAIKPSASVGRNVFYGGYGLVAEEGSRIGRDLYIGGYEALLRGEIARDVAFGGAALELNGKVGRDVKAEIGSPADVNSSAYQFLVPGAPASVPPGLRVSKTATIGGKLGYASTADQATSIQNVPEGGVFYQVVIPREPRRTRVVPDATSMFLGWMFDLVREFLTLSILGLLALWLVPTLVTTVGDKARSKPLGAAGWGVLVLLGGFILALLTLAVILLAAILLGVVTLGGLAGTVLTIGLSGLGLAFGLFMLMVSYGSKVVIAYFVGKVILQQLGRPYADHRVVALLLGVGLLVLVTSIPVLGGIIGLVAVVVGLGAMWYAVRDRPAPQSALAPAE